MYLKLNLELHFQLNMAQNVKLNIKLNLKSLTGHKSETATFAWPIQIPDACSLRS